MVIRTCLQLYIASVWRTVKRLALKIVETDNTYTFLYEKRYILPQLERMCSRKSDANCLAYIMRRKKANSFLVT